MRASGGGTSKGSVHQKRGLGGAEVGSSTHQRGGLGGADGVTRDGTGDLERERGLGSPGWADSRLNGGNAGSPGPGSLVAMDLGEESTSMCEGPDIAKTRRMLYYTSKHTVSVRTDINPLEH